MTYDEERFVETWKSVIDFSKIVIGLSTSVLTVILGLIVVGQLKMGSGVIFTVGLLILSVVLALFGFGRGIRALSKGTAQPTAVLLSNFSASILVAGIVFLTLLGERKEMSVDDVLSEIASSAQKVTLPIKPEQCQSVKRSGDDYEITYAGSGKSATAVYSVKDRRIKEIK